MRLPSGKDSGTELRNPLFAIWRGAADVATVQIPRTARRHAKTWTLLIRRISRDGIPEGTHFRPGAIVEEEDLRPTPEWPAVPLLIEFAGTTGVDAEGRAARGHNRSLDVHILWRFGSGGWFELARSESAGAEWRDHFADLIARELARFRADNPLDHVAAARAVTGRICAAIDLELGQLEEEGRRQAVSFLYDQIASRLASELGDCTRAPEGNAPERRPAGRELRSEKYQRA